MLRRSTHGCYELIPAAWHHVERYANNWIEADHGRAQSPAATDARAMYRPACAMLSVHYCRSRRSIVEGGQYDLLLPYLVAFDNALAGRAAGATVPPRPAAWQRDRTRTRVTTPAR